MQQGVIVKIMDKGFGFIKRDGQEKDLFFHLADRADMNQVLNEGDTVSFGVEDGPKGPRATQVTKVG